VYNGKYPLWRYLLLYVNRKPSEPLDPLREQFLMFVLSREGQEIVIKDGYLPLPKKVVDEEIAKLK
jgi:phosphate transport system substrate-binding protein